MFLDGSGWLESCRGSVSVVEARDSLLVYLAIYLTAFSGTDYFDALIERFTRSLSQFFSYLIRVFIVVFKLSARQLSIIYASESMTCIWDELGMECVQCREIGTVPCDVIDSERTKRDLVSETFGIFASTSTERRGNVEAKITHVKRNLLFRIVLSVTCLKPVILKKYYNFIINVIITIVLSFSTTSVILMPFNFDLDDPKSGLLLFNFKFFIIYTYINYLLRVRDGRDCDLHI